jgi:hypothetical protein
VVFHSLGYHRVGARRPRLYIHDHAADIRPSVGGQHNAFAGEQVEPDQRCSVAPARITQVQDSPFGIEVARSGGTGIIRREVQEWRPRTIRLVQYLACAARCKFQRQYGAIRLVRHEPRQPRIHLHQFESAACQIETEQIVKPLITLVQRHQQLASAPAAHCGDPRAHSGERREIPSLPLYRVDTEQMKILIPTYILEEHQASGVGPAVDAHATSAVPRHCHRIAKCVSGCHEHVENAVHWGQPGQHRSVRADARSRTCGIAEQLGTRDQHGGLISLESGGDRQRSQRRSQTLGCDRSSGEEFVGVSAALPWQELGRRYRWG